LTACLLAAASTGDRPCAHTCHAAVFRAVATDFRRSLSGRAWENAHPAFFS
jgi:hypothetical protein